MRYFCRLICLAFLVRLGAAEFRCAFVSAHPYFYPFFSNPVSIPIPSLSPAFPKLPQMVTTFVRKSLKCSAPALATQAGGLCTSPSLTASWHSRTQAVDATAPGGGQTSQLVWIQTAAHLSHGVWCPKTPVSGLLYVLLLWPPPQLQHLFGAYFANFISSHWQMREIATPESMRRAELTLLTPFKCFLLFSQNWEQSAASTHCPKLLFDIKTEMEQPLRTAEISFLQAPSPVPIALGSKV